MPQELLPMDYGATPATQTCEAISLSLAGVLRRATTADEAAQTIIADADLLAECRASYPHVLKLSQGCGRQRVYVALQPLVLLFGRPSFGEGPDGETLRNAWTSIFADALHKLCAEALDAAVAEWIQRGRAFFPKPSDLYKLAEPHHIAANLMAYRMRRAIERADAAYNADRDMPSPEDRAKVREMLAELKQQLGLKSGAMIASQRLATTPHRAAERLRRMAS